MVEHPAVALGPALSAHRPITPLAFILAADASAGDRTFAFVGADGESRGRTVSDLYEKARRLLAGLRRLGLNPGDTVVLHFDSAEQMVPALWAALLGGYVAELRPSGWARVRRELLRKVMDKGSALLTTHSLRDDLGETAGHRILVVEEVADTPPAEPFDGTRPDDMALVLHSGRNMNGTPLTAREVTRQWSMRGRGVTSGGSRLLLDYDADIAAFAPDGWSTTFLSIEAFVRRPQLLLEVASRRGVTHISIPTFAAALIQEDVVREPTATTILLDKVEEIAVHLEPASATILPPFAQSLEQFGVRPGTVIGEYRTAGMGPLTAGKATVGGEIGDRKTRCIAGAPAAGIALRIGDGKASVRPEGESGAIEFSRLPDASALQNDASGTDWAGTPTGDTGSIRDGELTLIGRSKDWITINGRNYPSVEIESVVEALPGMTRALAVNCGSSSMFRAHRQTDNFALFFVVSEATDSDPSQLAKRIRNTLASAFGAGPMLVTSILPARVPRTALGKVQRSVLAARLKAGAFVDETVPFGALIEDDGPTAELQQMLARLLRLKTPPSAELDVYAAGCDRIDALRFAAEVEQTYGLKPEPGALASTPLSGFAKLLGAAALPGMRTAPMALGAAASTTTLDPRLERKLRQETAFWPGARKTSAGLLFALNAGGSKPPLFWCLQGARELVRLAQRLGPDQPVYGMRSGLDAIAYSDPNTVLLAKHYAQEVIDIDTEGPYWLGGNCQGGLIAAEIARILIASGREVSRLTLVDAYPFTLFAAPMAGRGQVDMIFGRDSRFNPKQRFRWPELGWRKFFPAGVRVSYLACDHARFFDDDVVGPLTDLIAASDEVFMPTSDSPLQQAGPRPDAYWARYAQLAPVEAAAGAALTLDVTVANHGPHPWYPTEVSGVTLGNHWLTPEGELLVWADGRAHIGETVPPDGSVTLRIDLRAPSTPGDYVLEFDMVEEGLFWFKEKGVSTLLVPVRVSAGRTAGTT